MVRFYLVLAVVAIATIVLFWRSASPAARAVRWIAMAYLAMAAVLLAFGIGL